jgi:hypothetical protein
MKGSSAVFVYLQIKDMIESDVAGEESARLGKDRSD